MTAPANWHDARCLADVLYAVVVDRPDEEQHLLLDKGYDNPLGRAAAEACGYTPHIQTIRQHVAPRRSGRRKPRRWVVERTLAWLRKCRSLLIRYNKRATNYLGLLQLACALIWYRRYWKLTRKRVLR